jgi:hypothetical protein
MKNVLPGTALLLLFVWLTACATTPSSGPRRSANVLTADEIAEAGVLTAAEAIQRLRPQWLQNRSSPTFRSTEGVPPMLYLDGIRMDGLRELERIRATAVAEIRYMNPTDATNRYGTDHVGGAILVTTR